MKTLRKFVGLFREYNLPTKLSFIGARQTAYALDIDTTIISAAIIEALKMFLSSKEKSRN